MNKSYRSVWSESLGAWVATAENTRSRGKRGSVRMGVVAAAAAMLAGSANLAWADLSTMSGSLCMSKNGSPPTWTCQVPNGQGGFSIISGLPDDGTGASPNWPVVNSVAAAANTGKGALLLGDTTTRALGERSIAIGVSAQATGIDSVAIGTNSKALAPQSVAVGFQNAAGDVGAEPTDVDNVAIGNRNVARVSGTAMGRGNTAIGSTAIGVNNFADGGGVAMGQKNTVSSPFGSARSAAMGFNNTVSSADSVALGAGNKTSSLFSVAIGVENTVDGQAGFAAGAQNKVLGNGVALGTGNTINTGASGYVLGSGINIGTGITGAVALGGSTSVTQTGGVALGQNSVASTAAGAAGFVPGTATAAQASAITATNSTLAAVSVGNAATGKFRQITGVAAGSLDSDAVNVAQLKAVSNAAAAGAVHYYSVKATDQSAGSNYDNDGATGDGSLAAGFYARAGGDSATAVGMDASAAGGGSTAIGVSSKASGLQSVAIGPMSTASALSAVAIGTGARSRYEGNIVIGRQASDGGGDQTIVIGDAAGVGSKGIGNFAIGYHAGQYTGTSYLGSAARPSDYNTALGRNAGQYVNGGANLAVGDSSGMRVEGSQNAAFGPAAGNSVTGTSNLAIGSRAGESANGDENIAIGRDAAALVTGTRNVGLGAAAGAGVKGVNNIGIGYAGGNSVNGDNNSSVGYNAGVSSKGSSNAYFGTGAGFYAQTDLSVALGASAGSYVQGFSNVALGRGAGSGYFGALLDVDYAISIGDTSQAAADRAIAIGTGAKASGVSSISIGTGNVVSGARSGAIGDPSYINADDSYAIGNNNTIAASAGQSFVLGNNVTVNNANNVVLGNNSADKAAVQVTSASVPGVIATLNADGTVTYTAGPAVTYSGFAGTASGVVSVGAAGAERQIVNVAPGEISATSTDAINGSQLYAVASAVNTLGGNITTIVNNAQTHYYSVNDGGTQQGNYANDGAAAANSIAVGAGASVATGAVNSLAVGANASATTANSVAVGPNATVSTDNSVALGAGSTTTAATPTASTTIQGQTYNFAGANPVGVVSVGAAGAERQIQNVAAGQLSATSTDAVNGSQLYATNQAINNIQTGGGIKYFHANSQAADSQAAGAESVAIGPQAIALGASAIAAGNGAQANGAGSIALGASAISASTNGVALGNGASADRAGMAGGKELFSNAVVHSAQGAVSVGSAGNERQITNVAGGTQATDAVNVRQLQAVQQSTVRYDTNVDGTVNYNSVTMGNGGSTGPVTVHNVAPGVAPTDAVNVQQLQGSVVNSAAYTDARVNQMGQSIDQIGKKAYAGVAAAMAMESAPYVPGKVTYAAGMGYYEQQSAVGVSLRKTADNGRWSVTGGASATSRGTIAFRVGVGGVWD